jgi:hypothetical protein
MKSARFALINLIFSFHPQPTSCVQAKPVVRHAKTSPCRQVDLLARSNSRLTQNALFLSEPSPPRALTNAPSKMPSQLLEFQCHLTAWQSVEEME